MPVEITRTRDGLEAGCGSTYFRTEGHTEDQINGFARKILLAVFGQYKKTGEPNVSNSDRYDFVSLLHRFGTPD